MRAYKTIALMVVAGVLACASGAQGQASAGGGTGGAKGGLAEWDQEFQQLYKNATDGLVRVNVAQSAAAVLSPTLKGKFDDWRKANEGGGGGGRGRGGAGGDGRGGRGGAAGGGAGGGNPGPATGVGGGGPGGFGGGGGRGGLGQAGMSGQVGAFLQSEAQSLEKQAKLASTSEKDRAAMTEEAARLRGLALRVDLNRTGFQGEMSAAVIDDAGHVLLLTGLLREMHADPLPVTLSNGKETTARFVGGSVFGGFTILELANREGVKPLGWSKRKLMPGQLLLSVTAGQGLATPVLAGMRPGSTGPVEEHLAVSLDERSGAFLFDVSGNLAAVVGGGGLQGERKVISAARMERDIGYVLQGVVPGGKPGKDIEPRPLGLTFSPEKGTVHRGVVVTSVQANSPAADAGLKKDDVLLSIDSRPVSELVGADGGPSPGLVQVQLDLATRTGNVPLVVERGGMETTLQMPLR